jgi:hypothetical protein
MATPSSALPKLLKKPQHFPDCCLGLSAALIRRIEQLLPPAALVLSIGSGTGLFEALLQESLPSITVEGVEVSHTVNKYLSADRLNVVGGTWDICSRTSEASILVFVYPREPKLIRRYLQEYGQSIRRILWIGPRADWPDFKPVLGESNFFDIKEIDDSGLAPYEMLVSMTGHHS